MSTPKRHGKSTSSTTGVRSDTPEALTLLSYLNPITSLDEHSVESLKKLLKLVVDFRQATSNTSRIQRGSPNAHALGSTISSFRPRLRSIVTDVQGVFAEYECFPGMYLVRAQFSAFQERLNENFNDGGNEAGYSERVRLLEKLMYLNGTLRGHLEMILEQHSYWKAKLAGQDPPRAVRRLDFNQEADIPLSPNIRPGTQQLPSQGHSGPIFGNQQLQLGHIQMAGQMPLTLQSSQNTTARTRNESRSEPESISGKFFSG